MAYASIGLEKIRAKNVDFQSLFVKAEDLDILSAACKLKKYEIFAVC